MGQVITLAQFRSWLLVYADRIIAEEAYLTQLDAAIGDADHGANMVRGLTRVGERLADPGIQCDDIGTLLRTVAMTLISSVGGAAGPLFGAFFLRAAQAGGSATTVALPDLANMFRQGLEGMQQRGKAQAEDKTMVDTLIPAVEALEQQAAAGADIAQALEAARRAAAGGMAHTIGIQAHKGRASYLGARSIGHQDPGATSTFFLLEAAAATLGTSVSQDHTTTSA
jgi:phosphoenolpyruvate---glycerone phosphotransferase subunit DhaL